MADLNNTDMPDFLGRMSSRVVAIIVEPADKSKTLVFSGTVVRCRQDWIYMVTISDINDHIGKAAIKMRMTNNDFTMTLDPNNFHMDGAKGIVGIRIANPPPQVFQHLEEIAFNEDGILPQEKVYSYIISMRIGVQMLTPGSIIFIDGEGSFDHNSAGYKFTHLGAPVLNEDGLLVGISYIYSGGYYSAYRAELIADEIDRGFGRSSTGIADALQNLRQ